MARKKIRSAIAAEYDHLCSDGGWIAVGERWGLSPAMAWRIVREGYWPRDAGIRRGLVQRAWELGVAVRRRGRRVDLYAMETGVLRWKLENRKVMNGE